MLVGILLWLGANLALISIVVLATPLYYTFRRGLRLVLIHGPRCQGSLLRSLLTAMPYALGYALIICGALVLMDGLVHLLRHDLATHRSW